MKPSKPRPLPSNIIRIKKGSNDKPKPEVELPDPPDHFDEAERACWTENARILAEMGLLTDADHMLLQIFVLTWLRWRRAVDELGGEYTVRSPKSGYPIQNPLLSVINTAQQQLLKIMIEIGYTPRSRARLRTKR